MSNFNIVVGGQPSSSNRGQRALSPEVVALAEAADAAPVGEWVSLDFTPLAADEAEAKQLVARRRQPLRKRGYECTQEGSVLWVRRPVEVPDASEFGDELEPVDPDVDPLDPMAGFADATVTPA